MSADPSPVGMAVVLTPESLEEASAEESEVAVVVSAELDPVEPRVSSTPDEDPSNETEPSEVDRLPVDAPEPSLPAVAPRAGSGSVKQPALRNAPRPRIDNWLQALPRIALPWLGVAWSWVPCIDGEVARRAPSIARLEENPP